MRYQQVKELVQWIADFHGSMADQYEKLAAIHSNDRVRMALEYMAERERQLQTEMQTYLHDSSAHRGVLDTWFDDPVDYTKLPPVVDRLAEGKGCQSVQDVIDTALTAHQTIQEIYELRADRANVENDTEFFTMLAEDHDTEMKRIMQNLQRIEEC